MGWGFRKRVKVAPGIKLNFSKSGTSVTVGGKGASVNVGKKGVYGNVGIPGTGIYNREKISDVPKSRDVEPEELTGGSFIAANLIASVLIGLFFAWAFGNMALAFIFAPVLFVAVYLVRNSKSE